MVLRADGLDLVGDFKEAFGENPDVTYVELVTDREGMSVHTETHPVHDAITRVNGLIGEYTSVTNNRSQTSTDRGIAHNRVRALRQCLTKLKKLDAA